MRFMDTVTLFPKLLTSALPRRVTTMNLIERLMSNIQRAAVVEREKLRLILASLIARGRLLLEDVPGVGKTLLAKALAQSLAAAFKRVQGAPDLLPSDVTGSRLYDQRQQDFVFVPGPLFAHIGLVDEINRAAPRAQSALAGRGPNHHRWGHARAGATVLRHRHAKSR
jgi:MoxR-like ATPase